MKLIAHRGNTNGPSNRENCPSWINRTLDLGFDVEIDVWFVGSCFWLGHDQPTYRLIGDDFKLLQDEDRLWCHAKNRGALKLLLEMKKHCFWHQNDDYTLTNRGYVWTFPGVITPDDIGVSVLTEPRSASDLLTMACYGVCSDYVSVI